MSMLAAVLALVTLSFSAHAGKPPAPAEFHPLMDAVVDAVKKGDAKAIVKLYGSFADVNAACQGMLDKAMIDSGEKRRAERAEKAVKDCAAVDWKKARRVLAEGGELKAGSSLTEKCQGLVIHRDIVMTYEAGGKKWHLKLDGLAILKGKPIMMESPSCREGSTP